MLSPRFLLALALAAVAGCDHPLPPELDGLDKDTVSLERDPGELFRFVAGEALSASIARTGDGYQVTGMVLEATTDPDAECLNNVGPDCLVAVDRPARDLTPVEISALVDALDQIPGKECTTPFEEPDIECGDGPLVILEVDGYQLAGTCCGTVNQAFRDGFDRAVALIDGLF